jgi:hypothetical protein
VDTKLSGQFPHSFYGIDIGTVGRKVIKAKLRLVFLTPSAVKFGVVVFRVVRNDDVLIASKRLSSRAKRNLPSRSRTAPK